MSLLEVCDLTVSFTTRTGTIRAVAGVSFDLERGQTLGIVGESGSGKSVLCYSLLGLLRSPPARIDHGTAMFAGRDLLKLGEKNLRSLRGNRLSMIFQDPMTSLNPYLTVGRQLIEPLCTHKNYTASTARLRAIDALEEVGIDNPELRYDNYPHQLSGGMRQRVMIAMALITRPEVLIADEPTTALDVTVQAQILELIRKLQTDLTMGVVFVSHDLGVIARIADRILVMENGKVVEHGTRADIFERCRHPYTRRLLASIPNQAKPDRYDPANRTGTNTLLSVQQLQTAFASPGPGLVRRRPVHTKAVDNVSLVIYRGETLGLVGESGSGKSTLGRSVMRLVQISAGRIFLNGRDLAELTAHELRLARREIQMVFQDPYASLNPRMTVFDALSEALQVRGVKSGRDILTEVGRLMEEVGLSTEQLRKYPHEFSGGQRQRIAIARALALKPALIIADEPVSALDVTIQAQILELLLKLTREHHLTMLFISHDLSVVRYMADRTAVMYQGRIVELDETETVFHSPKHPYTRTLLSAIPSVRT